MSAPEVVVLDYGSGNVRSAVRALERAGASVTLTADFDTAEHCDGLVVPGVGAFAAVAEGLRAVHGDRLVERRLAGGRPVLGICVGLQVMFEHSVEFDREDIEGLGQWPGVVELLPANVVPHMGWNTVEPPVGSSLFAGVERERFYFVHSYGVQKWELPSPGDPRAVVGAQTAVGGVGGVDRTVLPPPLVTWAEHGTRFVAAVENGPLTATQFHPEKSGDAGCRLLRNWLAAL